MNEVSAALARTELRQEHRAGLGKSETRLERKERRGSGEVMRRNRIGDDGERENSKQKTGRWNLKFKIRIRIRMCRSECKVNGDGVKGEVGGKEEFIIANASCPFSVSLLLSCFDVVVV